jgi:NAD-dependent DNA ligase
MNKIYDNGEILRYAVITGDYKSILYQVKRFCEEAEYMRPIMPFTYDGIVCTFLDPAIRKRLGRVNSVNKYQMAIKFNPMKGITQFLGYTFSVAQNGVITPIAHYNPVELFGCTHTKTTVHSYKRFIELGLKVGDIVSVELINDVIPYINKMEVDANDDNPNPVIEFPRVCPCCGTELVLSPSGKSAICPNHSCSGRALGIVVNMLDKIGFKDFSEESLKVIGKIHNLSDLLSIKKEDVICLGEKEAENFMVRLEQLKTNPIQDYRIIGGLGFSNVASETWKLILNKIGISELLLPNPNLRERLLSIKGIGPTTADTIVSELDIFMEDLAAIVNMPNVIWTYGIRTGKKIRFTGVRDKDLTEYLLSIGHDAKNGGGITKDTDILLVPDEDYYNDKMNKVGPNCVIVPINVFKENMEAYLR